MGLKHRTNKLAVIFAVLGFLSVFSRIKSLENGLARTPPMVKIDISVGVDIN